VKRYIASSVAQIQRVADIIRGLNPKKAWQIEIALHRGCRTLAQNKLYWAIVMEIANETGHSKDEIHDAMKQKFLPPQTVTLADEAIEIPASTPRLDKKQMADYIERVCVFAHSELGIAV
jgi:hypothetical protein